jgi:thiol-disulfide isomerase/thioredoxin
VGDGSRSVNRLAIEVRSENTVRAYKPSRSGLGGTPQVDLVKEPKYQSRLPKYGKMIVGNTADSIITIVMDEPEGQPPKVYIDLNNDKDLTNDGDASWDRQVEGVFFKERNVVARFRIDNHDTTLTLPYTFYRFADEGRKIFGVLYYRDFARVGRAKIGETEYKISLTTFNNSGDFSNISDDAVVVDLNQDGKLETDPKSKEFFETRNPFNIAGESYRVKQVSVLGDEIEFVVSKEKVEPKMMLAEGYSAPDFEQNNLDGKPISLNAYKGKVVLLDFWATWCGPCLNDLPEVIKLYEKYRDQGFDIIGVSLDGESTRTSVETLKKFVKDRKIGWEITYDGLGWNNAVAQKYQIKSIPYQLLVDQEGIIQMVASGFDQSGQKIKNMDLKIKELTVREK